jgi:ATP-dependent Lon protease
LKTLIFPEKNRSQVTKLKDEIKEGIEIKFVNEYREVFKIVFPGVDLK